MHTAEPTVTNVEFTVSMEHVANCTVHCMRAYSCGVCPAFIHSTNSSTLGSDAVQGCNIHHHQPHPHAAPEDAPDEEEEEEEDDQYTPPHQPHPHPPAPAPAPAKVAIEDNLGKCYSS